jgi:PhnB protein
MTTPAGFSTVTPYFFVDDAKSFISFLLQTFSAHEEQRSLRDDGAIGNAIIRLGNTNIMVSEATAPYPAMQASYYLYVDNADDVVSAAVSNGAKLEMAVADMPYGDRQGGVRDQWGNIWWISQRLSDEAY